MSDHKPAGDKQGVNILNAFQLHQLSLKRFIGRYLNNAQDIEDVTQEAFLRAYKAERSTDVRQPKSFLFRIAKNVAISQLRTKSRQITDYIEDQRQSRAGEPRAATVGIWRALWSNGPTVAYAARRARAMSKLSAQVSTRVQLGKQWDMATPSILCTSASHLGPVYKCV